MSDSTPQPAGAQALLPTQATDAVPDAHGFDPQAYDRYPVLRRPRADGWTHAKQRLFIEVLADTASPEQAAAAVEMSLGSAYTLRRSPGAGSFAAWDAAIQQASKRLVDIAFERGGRRRGAGLGRRRARRRARDALQRPATHVPAARAIPTLGATRRAFGSANGRLRRSARSTRRSTRCVR